MWRPATKQITGTNDPPPEESAPVQLAQPSSVYPRQRPDEPQDKRSFDSPPAQSQTPADPGPRKRKSRWGEVKLDTPGLPTAISATGVSQAQLDNYAIHVRLEEINRKLRLNDFIPPERERSASPPPTYDGQGRRTNTREVRYRKKLEDERTRLVERAMKNDPNFRPPVEYQQQKRSQRPSDKVYIPVKEFPEINFFGLLVGPRGNSLKKMERESGAKISIRGKGSVKEGKSRPDAYADDAEEDLHCLVLAETEEKVAACVRMINRVIETAASTPEGQNDHKRNQLRELAALNGTLRDDENQICQNCGGVGHRKYDCPEQRNFTANIICRVCGSAGHMARDCQVNKDPALAAMGDGSPGGGGFDNEYAKLLAELGENVSDPNQTWNGTGGATGVQTTGSDVPPWRKPEHWQTNTNQNNQNQQQQSGGGYRPMPGGYYPQQHQHQQQQQWAGYQQGGGQDYSANNYAGYYQGYGQ
ncbi:splicing factor SF1 [Flagelloscypha sp. PMI_526]|nr:splicing factor SF1 [Flagelloscypha sp. PMI_526]